MRQVSVSDESSVHSRPWVSTVTKRHQQKSNVLPYQGGWWCAANFYVQIDDAEVSSLGSMHQDPCMEQMPFIAWLHSESIRLNIFQCKTSGRTPATVARLIWNIDFEGANQDYHLILTMAGPAASRHIDHLALDWNSGETFRISVNGRVLAACPYPAGSHLGSAFWTLHCGSLHPVCNVCYL